MELGPHVERKMIGKGNPKANVDLRKALLALKKAGKLSQELYLRIIGGVAQDQNLANLSVDRLMQMFGNE